MTWQTRYPEIATGIEKIRQKREADMVSYNNGGSLAKMEAKKAELKAANPVLYAQQFPEKPEPDWVKMLKI